MTRPIALITGASRGLGKHGALAPRRQRRRPHHHLSQPGRRGGGGGDQARALGVRAHALALDVARAPPSRPLQRR